jgi:hypothetical protein
MPGIAANGHEDQPLAEAVVAYLLVTLSIAIIIISVLVFMWPKKRFRP